MNNPILNFSFSAVYDGTSLAVAVDLKKDPIQFSTSGVLNPEFDLLKSLPSGVVSPSSAGPVTISGSIVTFPLLPSQPAGVITFSGYFTFG